MFRVTNNYMAENLVKTLNSQKEQIDKVDRQISTQNRIGKPHEDPEGTALVIRYRNQLEEYNRYEKNLEDSESHLNLLDIKLQDVVEHLQNIREEAVKGANGVYTKSDRQKMAIQVEQYLKEIVQVANSEFKGSSLFGGYKTDTKPYELTYTKEGDKTPLLSKIEYTRGDMGKQYREIDRGEYIPVNLSGERVFWGSEQRIVSQTNATGYIALSANVQKPYQTIKIDGVLIRIDDGDNLQTIVDKINSSPVAVKAQIDNTTGNDFLVLQTTKAHKMWLSDEEGGRVLQDLGILSEGGAYPPGNYAPSAIVYGKNLFEEIIELRDALLSDDTNGINRSIGDLDIALDNVRSNLGEVGSLQHRVSTAQERISKDIIYANEIYSKVQGTPMLEAVAMMKELDFAHRAALQVGAKLVRPTLLDFLR